MDLLTFALLAVLACGLCAAFILLRLARAIPARAELHWRQELEAVGGPPAEFQAAPAFPLSQSALVIATAMLLGAIGVKAYGVTVESTVFCAYLMCLLLAATINVRTAMLPDIVTQPALWAGLLWHHLDGGGSDSLNGAVACYLVSYVVNLFVQGLKRKVIIGHGDMKMFALAGAWLGVDAVWWVFGWFWVGFIGYAVAVHVFTPRTHRLLPTGPAHLFASAAVLVGL